MSRLSVVMPAVQNGPECFAGLLEEHLTFLERSLDAVTPVGTPGRRQAATWRRESILTWLERL